MANKVRLLSPADPPPGKKLTRYQNSTTSCNHQLGVSVIITPKLHAEHTREGIMYSWGITKGVNRCKPLRAKRGKESFKALVEECTSREILSTKTVHKLSRWARACICAYYHFMRANAMETTLTLTLPLIDCLVKAFKTNCAMIDFDAQAS
jgi:hypothetical protein